MNFKSVTINLLLTTLSAGVLLQTLEAQAASITFGAWKLNPPAITRSSRFAGGRGNATPRTLKAFAGATATANPSSWGGQSARTIVSLSNFFTVTPGRGEKNGDQVKGFLFGSLEGVLGGTGFSLGELTGSFDTMVEASVDAGFASFSSSVPYSASILLLGASRNPVNVPFEKVGNLTIGERYPFNMSLAVSASKTGVYQAFSNFRGDGRGFTANVRAESVPEPLTMLASATALGFGAFFKREHSKKPKKS
jgi:hypothetical protein